MIKKSKEAIIELINESDLADISHKLDKLIQESLQIITKPIGKETIVIGKSRIGGMPDLPDNIKWAENKGKPLSFIGQFNMKEIAPHFNSNPLPDKGMLYFFYDSENQPWGFEPENKDGWKIIYYDGDTSNLKRREAPLNLKPYYIFKPCSINFQKEFTLPDFDSAYFDEIKKNKVIEKKLYALLYKIVPEDLKIGIIHRLLGYPDTIEGDMALECQLASNGIDFNNLNKYKNQNIEKLKEEALDWTFLLQIDSDDINTGMSWENFGRLYFWIKKTDLKNRNFDNSWVILQSRQ